MATTESDGIDESLEAALRADLTVAAQIGQELSRIREHNLRTAEEEAQRATARARADYEAERAIAHAKLAPTATSDWWEHASPERIAEAHQYAATWKDHDPHARAAAERIRTEVAARYGIDVDTTGIDPARIRDGAVTADALRDETARDRTDQARETVEAQRLAAAADRLDRDRNTHLTTKEEAPELGARAAAGTRAGVPDGERSLAAPAAEPTYDSAERRHALAASLEGTADAETIEARLLADRDQGTHPRSAVRTKPKKAPRVVRSSGASQERIADLGR